MRAEPHKPIPDPPGRGYLPLIDVVLPGCRCRLNVDPERGHSLSVPQVSDACRADVECEYFRFAARASVWAIIAAGTPSRDELSLGLNGVTDRIISRVMFTWANIGHLIGSPAPSRRSFPVRKGGAVTAEADHFGPAGR